MVMLFLLENTQYIVSIATFFAILHLRNAHALFFGLGTLVSAVAAKSLKLALQQPRPPGASKYEKTYGMPSTHSCAIAFFAVYLSLVLLTLPLHPRLESLFPSFPNSSNPVVAAQRSTAIRNTLALATISTASAVCWSRVRLGHHSLAQVLAGMALGAAVALAWLTIWTKQLRHSGEALDRYAEGIANGVLHAWKSDGLEGIKRIEYSKLLKLKQ